MLIDIHCHLDHPLFNGKYDKIIDNAKKAGLKVILTAGINPETNRKTLELAKKYDIVKAALGIYPPKTLLNEIKEGGYPLKPVLPDIDEELDFIKKNKKHLTAIGECGLDYSMDENKENQKEIFQKQIDLAEKLDKPIIVHSRKAESDCIEMLESSRLKKVLLHCFSGKKKLVKKAVNLGFYFSVPTNVTRAQNFQIMAEIVNINQLFCETDSPYLSPFKEKMNEPANVIESYKKIAEIKNMDLNETINNIWMNWGKVFG